MSLFAGRYTYKKYDISFWYTPRTLKAMIWKPNTLILVKKFFVRGSDYRRLRGRVVKYIDSLVNG